MRPQIERAGMPAPRAIGVDEISIRKGHNYRVIVSDLDHRRPIWVGGEGRKEADLDEFFEFTGKIRSNRIKLAAMDMWKPFRNSMQKNAPNALIVSGINPMEPQNSRATFLQSAEQEKAA
ncbi:MAG: hypothetical protein DSZ28_07255 [Thiothrix sp.]|nr:MAG: hypothetical protein DSZ28_07255 [Thiothrix sp.]